VSIVSKVTRVDGGGKRARLFRTRFRVDVNAGPDKGKHLESAQERITVGTSSKNDLVLTDPGVSRHHLRIELSPLGFQLTDLGSTNGTWFKDALVHQMVSPSSCDLRLGDTTLRISALDREEEIPLHDDDHFGSVLGKSASMRELFRNLRQVSGKDVPILLEGETGTGKDLIARTIHENSARKDKPFIVVDCGSIPATLIESELFGHAKGAFTGAQSARMGAFEEASGGTIFLDEIGELELAMQPRLLRVLEQREIKRVGESKHIKVDVRVIAATHRDLVRAVNDGGFRSDLFYRLAVVHLRVPALRQRPEDLEQLVTSMLPGIAEQLGRDPPELSAETLQQMIAHSWPGNVRELRNFLQRVVALAPDQTAAPFPTVDIPRREGELTVEDLLDLSFREAKAKWTEHFDREYITRLLERTKGNVAEAARESGIDRVHLFRLVKRYGVKK
jgi:DNA-binding NtrC family response regulator